MSRHFGTLFLFGADDEDPKMDVVVVCVGCDVEW